MNNQRKFRVAEIFGPTIQGEGRLVGMPCHFIRFGGCDFRCTWCDTPHAVLPALVNTLPRMTAWEIVDKLNRQNLDEVSPNWVVLTGGNPGLLDLGELISLLHLRKEKVMLETQGSTFREWYRDVDDLCFSPKPPSSGMDWDFERFDLILGRSYNPGNPPYLKIPVFNEADMDWAAKVHHRWPSLQCFISIGNTDDTLPTVGNPVPKGQFPSITNTRLEIMHNYKVAVEEVLSRQDLADCQIFPQQHVLLWGNERGH